MHDFLCTTFPCLVYSTPSSVALLYSLHSLLCLPPPRPAASTATATPVCSDYTCPTGYMEHSDSDTTECFEGICDTEQCCMKWTPAHVNSVIKPRAPTSTTAMIVMCFEYSCPDGYVPHADYDNTMCLGGTCDAQQCCTEFIDNSTRRMMCSEYTCPQGYVPHADYYATECFDGACDKQQCCVDETSNSALEPTLRLTPHLVPSSFSFTSSNKQQHHSGCFTYECPRGHVLVDNADTQGCRDSIFEHPRGAYSIFEDPSFDVDALAESVKRDLASPLSDGDGDAPPCNTSTCCQKIG